MCQKVQVAPLIIVSGVVGVIVLVVVLGISLTNSLNLSNIIRLNEKVASDSANSLSSAETADASYINNHPRNLHKFEMINDDDGGGSGGGGNSRNDSYTSSYSDNSSVKNLTNFSHKTDNRFMIDVDFNNLTVNHDKSLPDEEKRSHIVKVI